MTTSSNLSSKPTCSSIKVIDLFAGPGGLGEGFASLDNGGSFDISVSAEMNPVAHETLRLRAFFRILTKKNRKGLSDYYNYCNGLAKSPFTINTAKEWSEAGEEAQCFTLGTPEDDLKLDRILDQRIRPDEPCILIGGPPCQAYSIVGRARNQANAKYIPESDKRHFLYREYLRVLKERQPLAFVMENVKGILSSKVGGKSIFRQILQDLVDPNLALADTSPGRKYRIFSLVEPCSFGPGDDVDSIDLHDFVIRAEEHGIPQTRHRVILFGVALDENGLCPTFDLLPKLTSRVSVSDMLADMPKIRSRLTRVKDTDDTWGREVSAHFRDLASHIDAGVSPMFAAEMQMAARRTQCSELVTGAERVLRSKSDGKINDQELDAWCRDNRLNYWLNHDARGHMPSDLRRYAYASVFAATYGISPKGHLQFSLPGLAPAHKNWTTGKFSDRFRVQLQHSPATTITSHISKDGHYFIHYDSAQCRSLTVREAARLQTFPDNYFFQGNRTQQYHQVGNAVPPMLASKIARVVFGVVRERLKTAG